MTYDNPIDTRRTHGLQFAEIWGNEVMDWLMEAQMVIYLDQYRQPKAAPVRMLKNGTYGDAIMNSNWNHAVIYMFNNVAQDAISPELPEDLSTVDVDAFLDRVYALATQI